MTYFIHRVIYKYVHKSIYHNIYKIRNTIFQHIVAWVISLIHTK